MLRYGTTCCIYWAVPHRNILHPAMSIQTAVVSTANPLIPQLNWLLEVRPPPAADKADHIGCGPRICGAGAQDRQSKGMPREPS